MDQQALETLFRWAGGGLQVAGVGMIGIEVLIVKWSHPEKAGFLVRTAKRWWRRIRKPPPRDLQGELTLGALSSASIVKNVIRHDPTVEERVTRLEAKADESDKRMLDLSEEVVMERRARAADISGLATKLSHQLNEVGARITNVETSGVHIRGWEVLIVFFGIAISTLAPELATWVS